jgi:hypothetical protein
VPKAKQVKEQSGDIKQVRPSIAMLRNTFNSLDVPTKDRVNQLLREHRVACHRNGLEIDNYELVFRESLDMAILERDNPELREVEVGECPAVWSYDHVYGSPRAET